MNRRGFTLVEVLAATTLATILVISAAEWLLAMQRSAIATRAISDRRAALIAVASALRDDLIHATSDPPLGQRDATGGWMMTVTGPNGGSRRQVVWRLRDSQVTRADRDPGGGSWDERIIATGLDAFELRRDDATGPLLMHLGSGDLHDDLPAFPSAPHAP